MTEKRLLTRYNGAYTGRMIRKLRKKMDMTAEELSFKKELSFKIGCSQAHLYNVEAGGTRPSLEIVMNLAKVLGVSADELLFEETASIERQKISDVSELRRRIMVLFDQYDTTEKKQ